MSLNPVNRFFAMFLKMIPKDKVREVCIDMKESLREAAEEVFPKANVVWIPST